MNRLPLFAVPLLAFSLASCGPRDEAPARVAQGPAMDVRVVRAGGSAGADLVLPARVAAREEVTLTARLAARLTGLPLREGDRFRRGQVLARFEAPETRAALASARAALESAAYQRQVARLQEARMESLYAARVAALREVEGARADRRAAEAGYAQALAATDQMGSGTAIEAPFDGVVVRRHADEGASLSPGQPLLDIRSAAAGEIACAVPESELPRLGAPGAQVQIGEGPWRAARLLRVDGMTDFATRSRVARFGLGAGEAALEPGAFARVRLGGAAGPAAGTSAAAASVPARALVRRGGLTGLFVVDEGVARLRWLRVGRESADRVEVLAGLEPGDLVVLDPAGLQDGRAVRSAP